MNGLYTVGKSEFPILNWRIDNVDYLLSEYIPFLISKLNTKKSETKDIKIQELTGQYSTEGFSYKNLKLLSFVLETNRGQFDMKVKLPVPSQDDIFTINRKYFILVNVLHDHIFYILNKTIYTVTFRISDEGLWYLFRGSQSKSQVGIPLISIMYVLDIIDNWFKDWKIEQDPQKDNKRKYIRIGESNEYFSYIPDELKEEQYYTTYNLIENSFKYVKKWSDIEKQKENIYEKVMKQNPFDYSLEYEFILGHNDLSRLYNTILESYQEKYLELKDEIHIDFKRVAYYSTLLKPFEYKIQNLISLFARAKNVDISWHQKLPNNLITKDAKTNKYLQYLELKNIFEEIAIKTKLTIPLENVPKYMRKTMNSAIGQICPIDSPDNKNIGIVQHAAITAKLDKNGYFIR